MKPLPPLGIGEEAAINLAMEVQANLLIIDDKCGRNVAVNSPFNLEVTGTVGLLEVAADENLINFELALNQLVDSHFYLSSKTAEEILRRHTQSKNDYNK